MATTFVMKFLNPQGTTIINRALCLVSKGQPHQCYSFGSFRSLLTCPAKQLTQENCTNIGVKSSTCGFPFHCLKKRLISTNRWQLLVCKHKSKPLQTLYVRFMTNDQKHKSQEALKTFKLKTVTMYALAGVVTMIGATYLGVPLYRMFCQQMGLGGSPQLGHKEVVEGMIPVEDRVLNVRFAASTDSNIRWIFKPKQNNIKVVPGETALAFYSAKNITNKPIIGIATYNVNPPEAALYFNKIQCFCFEEQRLNPNEEVDMPVFFYIDPEYDEDPSLELEDEIVLSYTFFESKIGMTIALPGYPVQETK